MKKGLKKQVEMELSEAIEKVLSRHHKKAIAKTKKAVKNSAKTVAKKFGKAIKSLEEKKKPVRKRRTRSAADAKDLVRTKRPYRRKVQAPDFNNYPDTAPAENGMPIPVEQHP